MRIQIIGASGSGKSTLTHALGKRLGVPVLSGDHYLWQDDEFSKTRPMPQRIALLREDMDKNGSFVFDGQIDAFIPSVHLCSDFLIFLLLDEDSRIKRLDARELERFGNRVLTGGDLYESSQEFLKWAASYRTPTNNKGTYLSYHIKMYNSFSGKKLVLSSALPVEALIQHILELMNT
ncbi:MAG: AAA family ATPase [Clostridiaceae bacterium]|nr:AAA family ATPase [Clostridiaceae bacterium]